ncbi:GNAT family N-acetyltransferase [Streptomyces sp. NPDC018029]|uniref:GNAT family N-acetyltransferase n=1 Tax=Streptomyces sp. NPDC018029 TaxID=3365032 RepID=UPI0037BAB6DE
MTTSRLRLEKITPDNVEAAVQIKVRADQEKFVSPVAKSLAEAYASPDVAWPRLIFHGEDLVGFVMAFLGVQFNPELPGDRRRSGLWRLNVAAGRQGRGYGRFAVEAVCEELRRRGESVATVTWTQGEGGPEGFYLGLGFRPTGEMSGGEVVGEMPL